jgi:hypothetical protein
MKLTEFISDAGRPIAFYPGLRKVTGSTTATLFLCQLIYWDGKQSDPDGWIYKQSSDIEEETGLTYEEQKSARKKLVERKLIQEHYKRLEHTTAFRINKDEINRSWEDCHSGTEGIPRSGVSKSHAGDEGKPIALNEVVPPSLNSNTETTTEITTENIYIRGALSKFLKIFGIEKFQENQAYLIPALINMIEEHGEAKTLEVARWIASKGETTLQRAVGSMNTALPGWTVKQPSLKRGSFMPMSEDEKLEIRRIGIYGRKST